jgi:hypothetical protein
METARRTAEPDDDLLPLSALNDFLFCLRRCALRRVERARVFKVNA